MAPSTKQDLISLVESMCEVQDRMLGARGMPEHIQRPHVNNLEALKAPVFFLWELLGYGTPRELSEKGIKRVWMAIYLGLVIKLSLKYKNIFIICFIFAQSNEKLIL